MRKALICFLIIVAFLGSSCAFLEEKEIKAEQTKITSIYKKEKYISIKVAGKDLKIYVQRDTKITKGESEIKFSDLSVEDKVDISYVKRVWLSVLGVSYSARIIKVLQ